MTMNFTPTNPESCYPNLYAEGQNINFLKKLGKKNQKEQRFPLFAVYFYGQTKKFMAFFSMIIFNSFSFIFQLSNFKDLNFIMTLLVLTSC